MAWTACCVSCAGIFARVVTVRRRRVGWRFRNHRVVRGRWGFRRRRHSRQSCSDDLGFVVVTHPFHPLCGQRLAVLFVKRRGTDVVFVCECEAFPQRGVGSALDCSRRGLGRLGYGGQSAELVTQFGLGVEP